MLASIPTIRLDPSWESNDSPTIVPWPMAPRCDFQCIDSFSQSVTLCPKKKGEFPPVSPSQIGFRENLQENLHPKWLNGQKSPWVLLHFFPEKSGFAWVFLHFFPEKSIHWARHLKPKSISFRWSESCQNCARGGGRGWVAKMLQGASKAKCHEAHGKTMRKHHVQTYHLQKSMVNMMKLRHKPWKSNWKNRLKSTAHRYWIGDPTWE